MNNHFIHYIVPPWKNPLTKQHLASHNVLALAKSSVSDWRRYYEVTQARHFQSVLFLCLKNSLQFMVGCVWGFTPATPSCGTPTRTVCRPYWRRGDSVTTLNEGG